LSVLAINGGQKTRVKPFPRHPIIGEDEKKQVLEVLDSGNLSTFIASVGEHFLGGKKIREFETKFCKKINAKFGVAFNSATSALHAAVVSVGVKPGQEVIVPPYTFTSTATSSLMHNAIPVFSDVKKDIYCLDPNKLKNVLSDLTKAIVPVHLFGHACDMDEILSIAKKHGLKVVEDCAHALGATYQNKKCGSIGQTGCFSFYPTKIITTGEGGMVTTNNTNFFKKISVLKNQGMNITPEKREKTAQWRYDIIDIGYNYRLDELRSSLGLSQFARINEINKKRIKIARKYDQLLSKIKGILIPIKKKHRNHIYHLYTIKVEKDYYLNRNELFIKLHKNGIGASVQYYPLHLMSYNKKLYKKSDFSNANILKDQIISLPIFPTMTLRQIEYVVSKISE